MLQNQPIWYTSPFTTNDSRTFNFIILNIMYVYAIKKKNIPVRAPETFNVNRFIQHANYAI